MRALDSYCLGSRKATASPTASEITAVRASIRRFRHSKAAFATQFGISAGAAGALIAHPPQPR